jgi:hypothetical protein
MTKYILNISDVFQVCPFANMTQHPKETSIVVTLYCIPEVLSSYLGQDIGYPDWGFSLFT